MQAAAATRKARAEADAALTAANDASAAAQGIAKQHGATAATARALYDEARAAVTRAEAAHADAQALALEVTQLRGCASLHLEQLQRNLQHL